MIKDLISGGLYLTDEEYSGFMRDLDTISRRCKILSEILDTGEDFPEDLPLLLRAYYNANSEPLEGLSRICEGLSHIRKK